MEKKDVFLKVLGEVINKRSTDFRLVDIIAEKGQAVGLVQEDLSVSSMDADFYRKRREEAIMKWMNLSGESREEAEKGYPEDIGKFIASIGKAANFRIPSFRIVFPDDWNLENIGLCVIEPEFKLNFLPHGNLSCYSKQIAVKASGLDVAGHVIFFDSPSDDPAMRFWQGLSYAHSVFVTLRNMLDPSEDMEESCAKGSAAMQGISVGLNEKTAKFRIDADNLVFSLISDKIGPTSMNLILSTFFPGKPMGFDDLMKSIAEASAYLLKKLPRLSQEDEEIYSHPTLDMTLASRAIPKEIMIKLIMLGKTSFAPHTLSM